MKLINKLCVSVVSGVCLSSTTVMAKPANDVGYVRTITELKAGSIEELAKHAGFAKFLPKQSEMFLSLQGGNDLVKRLKLSDMGKYFLQLAKRQGEDPAEFFGSDEYKEFMTVAGEEVFFALGDGNANNLVLLAEASKQINQFTYSRLFEMKLNELDPDYDPEAARNEMMGMNEFIPKYFRDQDGFLKTLKQYKVSPMYAGFKVSDKAKRAELLNKLIKGLQEPLKEPAAAKIFSAAESKVGNGFTGINISGKAALDEMKKSPQAIQQMDMFLGAANAKGIRKELARLKLTVLVGSVGDYIVFYVGDSAESLQFPALADSLLANPEMKFAKNYATKDIAVLGYMAERVTASMLKSGGSLGMLAQTLNKAIKKADFLGDTREVQDLLDLVGEKEKALSSMMSATRYGCVGYYEDGFKLDTYMGKDYPALDLTSKRKLTAMANHKDAVIYGSWIMNSEYTERTLQLLETLGEVAVKGTRIIVECDSTDEEFIEFASMFKMLDSQFSDDLLRVWKALRDQADKGLGAEGAIMVDLKGSMPRVPNVPTVVLEGGKVPRIAYAQVVENRAKLTEAWDIIDAASRDIAKGVSKMFHKEISLPKPERAQKGGLDIWSYQLGITSSKANLALGLNDKLFFLTTSPDYIAQRAGAMAQPAAEPGSELVIRFSPVRAAAGEWLTLLDKHGEEIMGKLDWKEYKKTRSDIKAFIKASEELELIDIFTRNVNGEVLSTLHIKTRK